MKKFVKKIIYIFPIIFYFFQIEKVQAIVPYYYFPTVKDLQKQSLYIGKNAYQLLYFGQYQDSLNLAKINHSFSSLAFIFTANLAKLRLSLY